MATAVDSRDAETRPSTSPWLKDKVLGTGGFGTVTLWRHNDTGETIALKKCRWRTGPGSENILTAKHIERWEKEVEIMNRLSHSAVVRCFTVPVELTALMDDLPMLCMEYCSGGDLRKVLNRPENCCGLREAEVRTCLRDMSDAISYLHSLRIIHRDLKPENIVLQDVDGKTVYKLIDLGYAKELDKDSMCTSFVGTLQYLAPELFRNKSYTCTVDYWSLGLVTHEIITGVRPFLPNLTPAEWMKYAQNKKPEHVCIYEGRDGEIQYSASMFAECHISFPLRIRIEDWLRLMLEWDPALRGQAVDTTGKKQVVAFTVVNTLLLKKIVKVFVVIRGRFLEYEIGDTTSMNELLEWVGQDCDIAPHDMLPLLPRGQPPDPSRAANQCWAPPDEEEWLLYVFSIEYHIVAPSVPPNFPSLVEAMLREPRGTVPYWHQRRMWSHAVFFLHREHHMISLLSQAQKVFMLHLMAGQSQLTKTGQKMLSDVAKLQARHHLFMEALNTDLDLYDEQAAAGRLTSQKLYSGWRGMGEVTLRLVHAVVDRVQQLDGSLTSLNARVMELQCSPFARVRSADPLETLLRAGEDLFCSLRRKGKEQRNVPQDNTEMCKLLLQALRKRDRLHQDLYKHLEKLSECCAEVTALSAPLEIVLQNAARAAQHISEFQKQRQRDIWKIMEIAIKHNRSELPSDGASMIQRLPTSPLDLPHKPPCPAVLQSLASLLDQSARDAEIVISENRSLRCQMVELLSQHLNSDSDHFNDKQIADSSSKLLEGKLDQNGSLETSL